LRDATVREVMIWSLPALVAGLGLRVFLTMRMPYGYVQYDSAEYLETAFRLLKGHTFFVDGKRGFLVPIGFTIPFLLHVPALIAIPLGQHALGLAATAMSGGLARMWLRWWRVFILPVTMFVAVNPMMLWYEQTIMGESEFLFALIFLALAGTLWARRQTGGRLVLFVVALVCAAGARPEGKLFFAFGLLLAVLVLWGRWRVLLRCAGVMMGVVIVWSLIVRQSTAPQLLYASLIQLTPDRSRLLPGVEIYINPLRDKVRGESQGDPQGLVQVSKDIRNYIDPYLWTKIRDKHDYYRVLNGTLRDLCLDAVMAHPVAAFGIPVQKFRAAADGWSAYQWTEEALQKNQVNAYLSDKWMYEVLGKGMRGSAMDEEGMRDFVGRNYQATRVAWVTGMQRGWNEGMIWARTADAPARHERWVHDFAGGVAGGLAVMPGVPWFYMLALVGMLLSMAWPPEARRVHVAWVPVMLGVWYLATFVGVTNARYRFAYEPFCFVYMCLLGDCVARVFLRRRGAGVSSPDSE
jgi:hypothetical protein